MRNLNISTLFSSLNNKNNVASSFDFSQYASIKNGTYGKLLKSYYGQQKADSAQTKPSTDKKTDKKKDVDTSGMSEMKKNADELKKATESLASDSLWTKTGGKYDMDKVSDAVKSFVKEYNDVVSQATKVNSKDIAKSLDYMDSMTVTMTKSLAKIGITVGADKKLTLDENKLKATDGLSVKSLFAGSVSYGSQTADRAAEIAKQAVMSGSTYSNTGAISNNLSGMFNQWI